MRKFVKQTLCFFTFFFAFFVVVQHLHTLGSRSYMHMYMNIYEILQKSNHLQEIFFINIFSRDILIMKEINRHY